MHAISAAKRPMATLAILATLTLGLATGTAGSAAPKAQAAEPKPAYATARLSETRDGTGHGTSAQTFVASANGFRVGDDKPDDGIVSSGDTVEYSLELSFTAAARRQVKVSWNLADAPYLQAGDAIAGFCESGQLVQAKRTGDSCTYTVPAGAVETLKQTLALTAKDTGGLVKTGQKPKLTVERVGSTGSNVDYPAGEVTVVSAPAADLVFDNGGMPDNDRSIERNTVWQDSGNVSGYLTIRPRALTYPGYTTSHGASTTGSWSTGIDVSAFPESTVFTMDGETLTPKNGQLRVENKTGSHDLEWSIPASEIADIPEGSSTYYAARIIPDRTVFSTGGVDADVLLNMGKGGEPGWDANRDETTKSADTGAIRGYPYANNDWTRAIIKRYKRSTDTQIPPGTHYIPLWDKTLARPYTFGATLFDTTSRDFTLSETASTVSHHRIDPNDRIATDTQVKTTLTMNPAGADLLDYGYHPYMTDTWDPTQQQWTGNLTVTQGGKELVMGDIEAAGSTADYTVKWTTEDPGKPNTEWRDGIPAATQSDVRAIRIDLNQNHIDLSATAANIEASFILHVTATAGKGNTTVADTMTGGIYKTGQGWSKTTIPEYVVVIAPAEPSTLITNNVSVTDGEGHAREGDAQPGDTASYSMEPRIKNIQLSGTTAAPAVTMPYPSGLINPVATGKDWQLHVEGKGKSRIIRFTLNTPDGTTVPYLGAHGDTSLPDITWKAQVGNKAVGTITAAATLTADLAANGIVPAYPNVTSNTATATFTVSEKSGESGMLASDQEKAEIGDPLSYTFNLYAKGVGRSGKADTVIHAPSNQDSKLLGKDNTGLDGSWNEYDRGSSGYHGTWELKGPVALNTDNSTTTTISYSTTVAWTDDPNDYTWKTWDELTDSERRNITAIRIRSMFETGDNGSMPVAAANGAITIQPSGNRKDDAYNWWPGRTRFTDGHTNGNLPWADTAKVVAGTISGTVWWDRDENTLMGENEERIDGILISLWKVDADGNHDGDKPLKTANTDSNGHYEFDLLHSGTYRTEVKRSDGTTTDDGVQTKTTTYYNQSKPVTNTYSWNWKLKGNASDQSDTITLPVGGSQPNVDYGYAKPDPKATLDKTQTSLECDDVKCTVNWDVKITNNGKTTNPLPSFTVTPFVAGPYGSSFAVGSDGNLYEWSSFDYSTPVKVPMPEGVVLTRIDCGDDATIWAFGSDGKIYVYQSDGMNDPGKFVPVTVRMPDDVSIIQIAGRRNDSFALGSDGNIYKIRVRGTDSTTITKVSAPEDVRFTQLSSAGNSVALDSNGNAYLFDRAEMTATKLEMPVGVTFTDIKPASWSQQFALGSDGNAYYYSNSTPVKVKMPEGVRFVQIGTGNHNEGMGMLGCSFYALGDDGNAYRWVPSSSGSYPTQAEPERMQLPEGSSLTRIYSGASSQHLLAQDSSGKLYAWNDSDSTSPIEVTMPDGVSVADKASVPDDSDSTTGTSAFPTSSTLTDRMSSIVKDVTATAGTVSRTADQTVTFTQVSVGDRHSLALGSDGNTYAWGHNGFGQLGDETTTNRPTPVKVKTPDGVSFTQISAGNDYSLALGSDGDTYAWGRNDSGRLGDGTATNRSTPVRVNTPAGVTFTQISAGSAYSLALGSDGNTYAWGDNGFGQLGDETKTDRPTPVKVKTPAGVTFTQKSAGSAYSLALGSDGNIYAWGWNVSGRLGDGTWTDRLTPVKVKTPDGVSFTQVSVGTYHSLAIGSDGNTYAWGDNYYGQLGDGTTASWSPPVKVKTPDGVTFTQISAGTYRSLAIGSDGDTYAWGWNYSGRLGDGTTTNRSTPVRVNTPAGVTFTQVSTENAHSLALGSDGNTYAWGDNEHGRLGDGTIADRSTPVKVKTPVIPGVSTDPTAVPVESVSTKDDGTDVTRVYNLPFTVDPGGYVVYHFTGTVDRANADQVIHNQAWFDSPDTPYSGTPHAREQKVKIPNKPDDSKLDSSSHDITGNASCRAGSDYSKPDMQHWFSTGYEDSCDQVGTIIPALTKNPVLGSISGLYWRDSNRDGIRQDDEIQRIAGQQVILEDTDGKQLATTVTDRNGAYRFDKLEPGSYRIRFSRVTRADFTSTDANDKTPSTDESGTDSDAATDADDYGMATPVITLTQAAPDKEHVDAGVLGDRAAASMLPYTGAFLLPVVLLIGIACLLGAIRLLGDDERSNGASRQRKD
ncbi:RCC1 repeat-containing protein [Bifidobacterium saguini DSM 23967]|uniref:RCC1 repeat-containing protein n=2 Tax=Bifidobacterium saguini TaxID=762210 RepID=A0A087D3Z8_9BIFI|nr:SdrD B-like domain-containing protein [Bifidobacterium saguini]KFI90248.1 RCC1 repeat-containing protein [Bifidobacterium saguini DSM 23967]QTB90704.1 carboxypeptidase regulatory-like domain-containing protein [Bifidobacterium saguini]